MIQKNLSVGLVEPRQPCPPSTLGPVTAVGRGEDSGIAGHLALFDL